MVLLNATEVAAHSCGSFTNFLDLQCLLVNSLSGSIQIFIGIAAFLFLLVAGWLKLPLAAVGMGFVLLGAILIPISPILFVVSIIFALIFIGLEVAQAFNR